MSADYIGVIVAANSNTIVAVINPDDDVELDNPRLLLIQARKEPLLLVKIPREDYMNASSMDEVASLVEQYR